MSLLVTALVGAGCSGGGSKAGGTTTNPSTTLAGPTTTEAATTTTISKTADPAKLAKAKAAVLQPTDLPAGFAPIPPDDGGGLNLVKIWAELMACTGVKTESVGIATSPTYKEGLATQAISTVEYLSDANFAAVTAAVSGSKFEACALTSFTADIIKTAPPGVTPGPVTVAQLGVVPPIAPKTTVFRAETTMALAADTKFPLIQDLVISFAGGAVIRTLFLKTGSEFPQDKERSLVTTVIGRV